MDSNDIKEIIVFTGPNVEMATHFRENDGVLRIFVGDYTSMAPGDADRVLVPGGQSVLSINVRRLNPKPWWQKSFRAWLSSLASGGEVLRA